jgi:hypothetical protein
MPNKIVEYTLSSSTNPLQMEIWNSPTDMEQIRTIWDQVQQQRPHLVVTKGQNGHINSNTTGTIVTGRPRNSLPINITTIDTEENPTPGMDDNEHQEKEGRSFMTTAANTAATTTTTTTTPTARMSLSELTSPGERLKRRRLISIAMDDIQYQLVCFFKKKYSSMF